MEEALRPSAELIAVINRWQKAVQTRNAGALANMLTHHAALRYVGSAEGEVWSGDHLREGFVAHVGEIPDFRYEEPIFVEAFECGPCGWGLWTGTLRFASDASPSFNRFTFVFVLEDGVWRIAQMHCSNPIPNMEKMGVEHRAMEELAARARAGFSLSQKKGRATILFTDVIGSTELAAEFGDDRWTGLIEAHFTMLRDIVAEHGGEFVKSLGDGAMSSFPDAAAALRAVAAIQRSVSGANGGADLRLRAGLHCGDVIQTRDDFFGTVVNKAARIAAVAEVGEARVSDEVRIEVVGDDAFAFDAPALFRLKGFDKDALTHLFDWRAFADV